VTNRSISIVVLWVVGLGVLVVTGPTIISLINALIPLTLVVGGVIAVLYLVRYFTAS
jgi:hypothetical protein